MEHKVKELLRLEISPLNSEDPYADVELTEEEKEKALRAARRDKAAAIHNKSYLEKISAPKQYPKHTIESFKAMVLGKIRTKIPEYVIDKYNEPIFHLLALYCMRDPEFEKIDNGVYSLNKGFALLGKVGVGKTTLARGFSNNPTNPFTVISARTVAMDYAHKEFGGSLAIQKYSGLREVPPYDFYGHKYIGSLYDDLGTEETRKHFGNESNVMQEIILNRYDNPELIGKTHFTSNLNPDEIGQIYGDRARSRIREMCNIFLFDPAGGDRRK